jgi:TetR/AcrR family transcriptional regulator
MANNTTRERILQAAHDRFTHQGFANTSVREICEDADVTAPVLYYHFGDKEGLFAAVAEEALNLDGFCDLVREEIAASSAPWDKLRAYVGMYLRHYPVHTLNPGLHLSNSTQVQPASLHQLNSGLQAIYQLARAILQAGIEGGEFREMNVDATAACLLGTVDSFVRAKTHLGVQYDPEEITDCIVSLYQHGLSAQSADTEGGVVERR